jgi:predicted AAA+ superfamily ATPase
MITRKLEQTILSKVGKGKAIILIGARQVGKTTLVRKLFAAQPDVLWLSGDDPNVHVLFETISAARLQALIGRNKTVVIDEAQRIADIGLRMKLIIDQMPDVQLVATGSSAFELQNKLNEPLTGRKWEYKIFPLSFSEMVEHHGFIKEYALLPHRLVFGYYPEVVCNAGSEKELLNLLYGSYLYKDILLFDGIKKSDKLQKLLQALAYQVGSLVSYTELGQLCGLDYKTVEKYIVLLEQCFVIFRLGSFNRNLRNELKNSRKVYFWDNGVRNAIISNFNPVELRDDVGALWENFMISERIKKLNYNNMYSNYWFWRTQQQQEIDFVEERDGKIVAFEFKWNPKANVKIPKIFLENYKNSRIEIIHRENFDEFL